MSRIGNQPILIPAGVTVEVHDRLVSVVGPKGKLEFNVDPAINVGIERQNIIVKRKDEEKSPVDSSSKKVKALHGLTGSLLANMVIGVTEGWTKSLELVGVGFRAEVSGNKLILNVGYSHQVEIEAVEGINFEVTDSTKIKVSGIDKQLVGQIAANLKKARVPDVYKGKGIRYSGEYIRKKVGKSAKVGVTGAAGAK